jgi:hypothetical protein
VFVFFLRCMANCTSNPPFPFVCSCLSTEALSPSGELAPAPNDSHLDPCDCIARICPCTWNVCVVVPLLLPIIGSQEGRDKNSRVMSFTQKRFLHCECPRCY